MLGEGLFVCLFVCFWSQTNLGSNLNSITNKLIYRKVIWTLFSHLKTGHKNTKWNVVGFYEIKFISTHGWCSMKVSFSFFSKHAHVGFTEKWYVFNMNKSNWKDSSGWRVWEKSSQTTAAFSMEVSLPSSQNSLFPDPQYYLWTIAILNMVVSIPPSLHFWRQYLIMLRVPFNTQYGTNHKCRPRWIQVAIEHISEMSCLLCSSKYSIWLEERFVG